LHINGDRGVFFVIAGTLKMYFKTNGIEQSTILKTGDIFYASTDTEHIARDKEKQEL
jgi:mannose-6-phosphate isomerase-like protein (cupin superfamily)